MLCEVVLALGWFIVDVDKAHPTRVVARGIFERGSQGSRRQQRLLELGKVVFHKLRFL
jgi:hypothetical protein